MFSAFDRISDHFGIHKVRGHRSGAGSPMAAVQVEIIGDAYFAVGGCPTEVEDHSERCAAAAIDMLSVCAGARKLPAAGRRWWSCATQVIPLLSRVAQDSSIGMRLGMHCGSVVAGATARRIFIALALVTRRFAPRRDYWREGSALPPLRTQCGCRCVTDFCGMVCGLHTLRCVSAMEMESSGVVGRAHISAGGCAVRTLRSLLEQSAVCVDVLVVCAAALRKLRARQRERLGAAQSDLEGPVPRVPAILLDAAGVFGAAARIDVLSVSWQASSATSIL